MVEASSLRGHSHACAQQHSVRTQEAELQELKGEIDSSIFLVVIYRSRSQKSNRDGVDLNSTIRQLDLIDFHKILLSQKAEYTVWLRLAWNIHQERSHSDSLNMP